MSDINFVSKKIMIFIDERHFCNTEAAANFLKICDKKPRL
jgi:hypothetical protein